MKWRDIAFKEFIILQRGYDLPRTRMIEGPFPVVGSNSIIGFHNEFKQEPPGVVTGRSGTLGEVQFIDTEYWPHNTSLWVKDFKNNYPRYVYYKLKTLNLAQYNGGGAVPTLNRNNLDNLMIHVPQHDVQQKIASILSAYDDLIENNNRRIKLLEESARLLYREWFGRLRFPGYEHTRIVDGVPEGWARMPLEQALLLQRGFDLPSHQRKEGDSPVYASTGITGWHNQAKVSGPGVVTGRSGTLGVVNYVHTDYWPLNTVLWVKEFKLVSQIYALFLLQELKLAQYNGGVSVPTLDRKVVHRISIVIPHRKLIALFDDYVQPMFDQLRVLSLQNQKLKTARDLLLPQLMDGRVEIVI